MSDINWKSVDLNLLLTFDALMTHQSVSRAAEQLFVGQSAMSYNLNRLRKLLNDPLFERQGHRMVPTLRAVELNGSISAVLGIVRNDILSLRDFDPSAYDRKYVIGLSDYAELVFGPSLFDQLMSCSPDSQIVFQPVDQENCHDFLESGKADVVIGVFADLSESLKRTTLYRERHVCMFDNKTLGVTLPLSLNDYITTPQAMVSANGELTSRVDRTLAEAGVQRRVLVGSTRFLTIRNLLAGRRLLCVMAEMMGRAELFGDELTICSPPIDIPDFDVEMVVRSRDESHPRIEWLCRQIKETVASMM